MLVDVLDYEGSIVNITGMVLVLSVKCRPDDAETAIVIKSTANSDQGAIVDGARGLAVFHFVPEDTLDDIRVGRYYYDVWLIDGANRYQVVSPTLFTITGRCTVLE